VYSQSTNITLSLSCYIHGRREISLERSFKLFLPYDVITFYPAHLYPEDGDTNSPKHQRNTQHNDSKRPNRLKTNNNNNDDDDDNNNNNNNNLFLHISLKDKTNVTERINQNVFCSSVSK
jgi:hypothetical protein